MPSPAHLEARLAAAMIAVAPFGVHVGCRVIRPGDEDHLLAQERLALPTRVQQARCASGAARHLARSLLAGCGHADVAIGRHTSGRPLWPAGVVGSLAHDDEVAVAAVASSHDVMALGIDVEPAEPLPDEVSTLVVTDRDEPGSTPRELAGRIVFAAKEAMYKAAFALDGSVLEHHDITVDLARSCARTRPGLAGRLYWCAQPRIVVVAVIPTGTAPAHVGTRAVDAVN